MIINDVQSAIDQLADAVWWFKGFAAARPPSIDEGCGEHKMLERQCSEIRDYLWRLVKAEHRQIGDEAVGSIALKFHEFEQIYDGLRSFTGDVDVDLNINSDRKVAFEICRNAFKEYQAEARKSNSPTIPF